MKIRNLFLSACLALSSTVALAQEISFGIIATDTATAQREKWEPFFKDMEKKNRLESQILLCDRLCGCDRSDAL